MRGQPVNGVGRVPCDVAIFGPYPGYDEDRTSIPFTGPVGDEITRHLSDIKRPRETVYLSNFHKLYHGRNYEYSVEEVHAAEPAFIAELLCVRPQLIVPLGREMAQWFLGDVDLGEVQNIPWNVPPEIVAVKPFLQSAVIFPITLGMLNSDLSSYAVAGFHELGRYLRGEIEPRTLFDDSHPETHYEEITTEDALVRALSVSRSAPLAVDTEGWPGRPWSLQWSTHPGTGYLIRHSYPELLRRFNEHLRRVRPRLVFHSALHDLGMFRALGLDVADLAFDDTMIMAYLLQIEEQGLKALCVRHCGMKMQSYEEVVGDVGQRLALDYLTWLWEAEESAYEESCQREFEFQRSWGRKIKKAPKLPKSALYKAVQRCLQSRDARKLWGDQIEDIQVAGYSRLGPMPEATLDYVPAATAVHYGCRDADGTTRVHAELTRRIDSMDLRDVYRLELSTYPLIERMSYIGLKPDLDHFRSLSGRLETEIEALQARLCGDTGRPDFNANSGDQVAAYLFDSLGLESMKRTSTGRGSTNDKILEALERGHPEYPVIATIRAYREYYKLKHTFVDRLEDFVDRWPHDGRIHASFRTTRVVTGRLAASDPNVLAQPEHGKFAGDFKRGWVCDDGHVLCQWDESQVELRGLAHLSQDPTMLAIYRGELRNKDGSLIDLHAKLAQRIFGGRVEDYMHKCMGRLAAKAINFGIPMGMTCRGLSVELRKNGVEADEDDAQRWLDETLALYTGVRSYMDERIAEAARNGYIRCLSGRIRYIGGIRSRDDRVREEAERFAFSTPIQESATFIMKQAEAIVWNDILKPWWQRGRWVEPLLQVHDCLKVEVQEDLAQELHGEMSVAMTQVPKGFSVPLAVEGEVGRNFKDMEAFS